MAVINLSVLVACLLGTGAISFLYTPGTIKDPVTNVTREVMMGTEFAVQNSKLLYILVEIVSNVGVSVTSLGGVVISNVIIVVRMRSVLAWRKNTAHAGLSQTTSSPDSSASANQREAVMTKMLLVLCGVYSICITPTAASGIARFIVPELTAKGRYRNTFYAGLCISHLLETVNCSANFLIYFTMSSKFNETLRELFCRGKNDKQKRRETNLATIRNVTLNSSLGP